MYFIGSILRRAASFIMLPIYTRFLTPADYGVIELLSLVVDLVSILVGIRIGEAIFRFYAKYENIDKKKEVISTSLILVFALSLLGMGFILIAHRPLAHFIFGSGRYGRYLVLYSITILLQGCTEVGMNYIRSIQKPLLFVSFSIIKLILQLGLNIYLVAIKNLHVDGVIFSALISGSIMALILSSYTIRCVGLKWSTKTAKEIVRFSIPLFFTSLIVFYVTFGDRYFLRLYSNLGEVGIYALGYKFGFVLSFLIGEPFNNIWQSEKYAIYKQTDAKDVYGKVFILLSLCLISAIFCISLFVKDLLVIMAGPEFHSAYKIVPIILLAYGFNIISGYTNLGILLKEKTIEITYGTVISAAVATVGYLTLIPIYGSIGAAVATLLAFAARFCWVTLRASRLYPMNLPWRKLLIPLLIAAVFYLSGLYNPSDVTISIAYHLLLLCSYIICLFLFGGVPYRVKRVILDNIMSPRTVINSIKSNG